MPGFLSGNNGDVVLLKKNDAEDGAIVGPALWTNTGGLFPVTSKFGSSYFSQPGSTNRLDSDSGISAFNNLDTAKYLYHFWWRTESLAPNAQTMVELGVAGFATYMSRVATFGSSDRIFIDHTKVGGSNLRFNSVPLAGIVFVDTFHSVVAYIDVANDLGAVFVDGIDRSSSISSSGLVTTANAATPFVRIGNHENLLDPSRFVDHPSIIQNTGFTVAQIAILAPLYHDTRGFGYNPQFLSVDFRDISPGYIITLRGTGFGADVNIKINGVDALNIVRLDDSLVTFEVPPGIGFGLVDLEIINVAAGVTWTETTPFNAQNTIWIPNGGSNRIATFGDRIKYGEIIIGDPLPFGNPNIDITDWTTISRSPA